MSAPYLIPCRSQELVDRSAFGSYVLSVSILATIGDVVRDSLFRTPVNHYRCPHTSTLHRRHPVTEGKVVAPIATLKCIGDPRHVRGSNHGCLTNYLMPMTCPISCRTTPSNEPSASKSAMSAMSNLILPSILTVVHPRQTLSGPAEPSVPPTTSIASNVDVIRSRPAGNSEFPPQGTWVITSDHLRKWLRSPVVK